MHDGQEGETQKKQTGSGPIWNEAIVFDVQDKDQPVVIQLVSLRNAAVLIED